MCVFPAFYVIVETSCCLTSHYSNYIQLCVVMYVTTVLHSFNYWIIKQGMFDFCSKCNKQMVELLPLELSDDLLFVEAQMRQFHDKTGSRVAANLLADWPAQASKFVKVRD